MRSEKTIRLLFVLGFVLCMRFLIINPISEYLEIKREVEELSNTLYEIEQEKERSKLLKDEINEMRRKTKNIQSFNLLSYFDVSSMEKRDERKECIEKDMCYIKKSYSTSFSTTFEDLALFFRVLMDVKSITIIRKLEMKRTTNLPEIKLLIDYVEVLW